MQLVQGATGPLYEQVADAIRRGIEAGELTPDAPIPSEAELVAMFDVSRDTIRKALAQLTQQGLISAGQGRNRRVRTSSPLTWPLARLERQVNRASEGGVAGDDAWSANVRQQGRLPSETIELGIVVPPQFVADRLGLKEGALAVLRKRVRFVDDRPYQLADSYFPESLVRGTPLMEPRSVNAPGGLLASIGHPQARLKDEIFVRMPSPDESKRLNLAAGTPVAEVIRTGYGADDRPLRVMVSIAPGDRNVLVYELDA